ncbi:MAG: hypothetical protein OXN23_00195, partial [Gammaproteobacteria bacterium]|nr:hypothetical protein [Gammaproteobacteria bacterium]
ALAAVLSAMPAQAQQLVTFDAPSQVSIREGMLNIVLVNITASRDVYDRLRPEDGDKDIEFALEDSMGNKLASTSGDKWQEYQKGWKIVPQYHYSYFSQTGSDEYRQTVRVYVSINNDNCLGEQPGDISSARLSVSLAPENSVSHTVEMTKIDDEPPGVAACSVPGNWPDPPR